MAKKQRRKGSWLAADEMTIQHLAHHAVLFNQLLDLTGGADLDEAVEIVRRWQKERRSNAN